MLVIFSFGFGNVCSKAFLLESHYYWMSLLRCTFHKKDELYIFFNIVNNTNKSCSKSCIHGFVCPVCEGLDAPVQSKSFMRTSTNTQKIFHTRSEPIKWRFCFSYNYCHNVFSQGLSKFKGAQKHYAYRNTVNI